MMKSLTRYFLVLALFALTIVSLPANAEVATQCSIDHAIKGALEFQQCPISDNDNDILNSGFDGVRLDAANSASKTPIWAFNTCHYVDNHTADALFIPLKSAQEWEAFIANPPANVHFAGCCVPRVMHVSDVPTPPTTCTAGWVLKGLVDSSNHRKLIATPTSATTDSGFTLASGVSDDSSYPVLKLPINRDDIGAVLPDNSKPAKTYAALYSCGDKLDYYVDFHMQCKDTQWVSDNAPTPAATTGTETLTPDAAATDTAATEDTTTTTSNKTTADVKTTDANCTISQVRAYSKKCASGSGHTSFREVFNSCTKTIETQTIMSTCGTSGGINGGVNGGIDGSIEGCFATSNTSTAPCPSNQAGSITTRIDHVCDGSNNGDGSDNVVILSNTCSNTIGGVACVPSDLLTTTPCPDPTSGGIITLHRVHVCDGSNNGSGSTTQSVVANNCTAGGCVESAILKTSTVCPGGMLTTAKVYNSCTKQISNVTVSNTCN